MLLDDPDAPIAALATPPGLGGIAIVRLSGADCWRVARRLLPPARQGEDSATRQFFHAVLRDPRDGGRLDEAVVLVFPAPHSYTGEEVVELQVHGGRLPAQRVLSALAWLGVRSARPGEFTRRAFLNGRLDLSQAEAVMDLVAAQSERAAHMAAEQLQGRLRARIEGLGERLVDLRADVEATLDFDADEVPGELSARHLAERVAELQADVGALLATWREGHVLRDGALVVVSGRPNVGKSALFNALLGRPRAIVAAQPGTTRDTLEELLVLDGLPLRLVDTAGLRTAGCEIERQGVDRAAEQLARADLHLRVADGSVPWEEEDARSLHALPPARTVVARNKADLPTWGDPPALPAGYRTVTVSALTGQGLDGLRAAMTEALGLADHAATGVAVGERHRELLVTAAAALRNARALCLESGDAVLIAQALREVGDALGGITGRSLADDVLDRVFARFCVGK